MELTDKCKVDFEKYAINNVPNIMVHKLNHGDIKLHDIFYDLPQAMQYGVYVDFFLTKMIGVDELMMEYYQLMSSSTLKGHCRELAIEEANKIYNKLCE